jgi:hypothetical protein
MMFPRAKYVDIISDDHSTVGCLRNEVREDDTACSILLKPGLSENRCPGTVSRAVQHLNPLPLRLGTL